MKQAMIILVLLGLLAGPSLAVPVDPNAEDEVAAYLQTGVSLPMILRTNGEVYRYDYDLEVWVRHETYDVPVPVSEIADWALNCFTTHDGEWWFEDPGAGGTWEVVPRPEWSPIPSHPQSLGSVKGMFRDVTR